MILRKSTICFALLMCCLYFDGIVFAAHKPEIDREYALKVAVTLNIMRFSSWPDPLKADHPLKVCVVGDSEKGHAFAALKARSVGDRMIDVAFYAAIDNFASCHVIYVIGDNPQLLDKIARENSNQPILIISEVTQFESTFGMLNLIERENRIQIQVSLEKVSNAKLKLSARLLKLVQLVKM